jgi:hypothetical protein
MATQVYLIDPFAKTVTETSIDRRIGLKDIYRLMDCRLIDAVRFRDTSDVIYVDDEGLYADDQRFFKVDGVPQPLAGKALYVGTTDDGDDCAPTRTLEQVEFMIEFMPDSTESQDPSFEIRSYSSDEELKELLEELMS